MKTEIIIGILFIIYGFLKISISILNFALPLQIQASLKNTILGKVITGDSTHAGRTFDVVLIIYALYSLVHGFGLIGYGIPFIEPIVKIMFYILLGSFLVIYYSIVLYSDLPITKIKSEYTTYSLYMLVGYLFLMTACLVPYYGQWM